MKLLNYLVLILLLFSSYCLAQETDRISGKTEAFAVANVRFEQNATDGDVEVVFEVKGGDEGLTMLKVISPDGRKVLDFNAPDASTLGIRQIRFESPEPKDVESLKAAYPEGVYNIKAESTIGITYRSNCKLNHNLPGAVSFLYPEAEADDVPNSNLRIKWIPVKNITSYTVEIDQEELGINIVMKIPVTVNEFLMPDEFLKPGREYTLSIGTVNKDHNITVVETTFKTVENIR